MIKFSHAMLCVALGWISCLSAENQTDTVSPILPGTQLPFRIMIEKADFQLPAGFQSGVTAAYHGRWLLLAGRTNGLHGFGPDNIFPPTSQNTKVYVVDPEEKKVYSRSLKDHRSGLTQKQIDLLSVTNSQFYQSGSTLYMCGGYGIDTASGKFTTKDALTAIDIPGLMHWVMHPNYKHETVTQNIRQIFHPVFKITGGYMDEIVKHETLLVFGQNFEGDSTDVNGIYSEQIRRFSILDDGKRLSVRINTRKPCHKDPNYRRRDLNVVPVVFTKYGKKDYGLVALSGVFTETDGIWTVPVNIDSHGNPMMEKPKNPETFKQAMNNYNSANVGLFSKRTHTMYSLLLGGITYGFFENNMFKTDSNLPFTNQCTAIKIDKNQRFSQYILEAEYPVILSTQSNPGNPLLFGTDAAFFLAKDVPHYSNDVVKLDSIKSGEVLLGYIVGGIQSSMPNTTSQSDSTGSPYIFKVILVP